MKTPNPHLLWTILSFHLFVAYLPAAALALWYRPRYWGPVAAGFLGLLVGFLDLRGDDLQPIVFLLLAFGFFTGFAAPDRALGSAFCLGLGVPLVTFAASLAGAVPTGAGGGGALALCVAWLPAGLGAAAGRWVRQHPVVPSPTA